MEILAELEERDRMLSQVSFETDGSVLDHRAVMFPDSFTLGGSVERKRDEFDLPLPDESEASLEGESPEPAFREDTLKDLPAIPYPSGEPSDEGR